MVESVLNALSLGYLVQEGWNNVTNASVVCSTYQAEWQALVQVVGCPLVIVCKKYAQIVCRHKYANEF